MKNFKTTLVLVAVCAGAFLWWRFRDQKPSATIQTNVIPADGANPAKPKYPVADPGERSAATVPKPVPKLEESDQDIQQETPKIFGKAKYSSVFLFEDFIRHVIVSVENATEKQIPIKFSPVKPAPGAFEVETSGDDIVLSPKNHPRYQVYVDLAQSADLKNLVHYYRRVYPLFQSTYEEYGYRRYFNDRVIEVIDNLLAAPLVEGPIHLKSVGLRYEFADPELESRSAIQKILIRMGPANARIIKGKFKELRQMLMQLGS